MASSTSEAAKALKAMKAAREATQAAEKPPAPKKPWKLLVAVGLLCFTLGVVATGFVARVMYVQGVRAAAESC